MYMKALDCRHTSGPASNFCYHPRRQPTSQYIRKYLKWNMDGKEIQYYTVNICGNKTKLGMKSTMR